jgi:Hint module
MVVVLMKQNRHLRIEHHLIISRHHLVLFKRNSKQYHIPTEDVRVGDILNGQRVRAIQQVVRKGMYSPLTQSGKIVINGVLASNYVDLFRLPIFIDQHTLKHGYGPLAYLLIGSRPFFIPLTKRFSTLQKRTCME